jgi:hypothetical protein
MIIKNTSTADAILAILDKKTRDDRIYAEPYQNGREHGWSVYSEDYKKQVSFSEHRNSDNIVVYWGETKNFSMQGNVPDDEIYRKARFFNSSEYAQASNFILDFLSE